MLQVGTLRYLVHHLWLIKTQGLGPSPNPSRTERLATVPQPSDLVLVLRLSCTVAEVLGMSKADNVTPRPLLREKPRHLWDM